MPDAPKPRMVFFRWTRAGLPEFVRSHVTEQLSSLEQFFEVIVIDGDSDYDEVCARLAPDLCVFESGVYAGDRAITNTSSHPEIPKLGFLHADAFDASRAAFVADMAQWGVTWFFTTSMSMAEYTPEIADRLFVWPNAIDPATFHDYEVEKNVPVLLTGSHARHYPWRTSVSRVLAPEFITMTMPHFGWNSEVSTARMVHGERYARLLSASSFVPTCGTVTKDVVRKHLEIPASGACLVTERTASIEAFGFVDMVNCVFATSGDVVEKLNELFREPERLERIVAAGKALVHEHHTVQHRTQVLQWFRLVSEHGQDITIDQSWPDGTLSLRDRARPIAPVRSGGRDRTLITAGWDAVARGDAAGAEREFLRCVNYFFIPEGAVGLAHSYLMLGDVAAARNWTSRLLVAALSHHHAGQPDPVQWAYEIRVMLCSGDVPSALSAARRFPALRNPELDRVRQAVATISGAPVFTEESAPRRATITPVPDLDSAAWTAALVAMLEANGRHDLGARLTPGAAARPTRGGRTAERRVDSRLRRLRAGNPKSAPELWLRARLSPLKRRVTTDPWSRFVADYVQGEPLSRALLLTADQSGSKSSRAVRRGLAENPMLPTVEVVDAVALSSLELEPGTLLFVTDSGARLVGTVDDLAIASVVILEGTNGAHGQRILETLATDHGFSVVDHRPDEGSGHAILRRHDRQLTE